MWDLSTTPCLTKSLLSLRSHPRLWPLVRDWQLPGFPPLSSKVPHPLLLHGMFESDPPPLPPPLALTQAYCPCSAAVLNSDCWLVVETEKEVLGVFIETLSFTRTITTLPHTKREREKERNKLTFGFTSKPKYACYDTLCPVELGDWVFMLLLSSNSKRNV